MTNIVQLRPPESITRCLRELADAIDAGEYGPVKYLVAAMDAPTSASVHLFGWPPDALSPIGLLAIARETLMQDVLA